MSCEGNVAPESRVVYVDRDPIVFAHVHALLRGTPEGATRYVYGELREPEAILQTAAEALDFTRPAAVLLFGILHFSSQDDDPAGVVRRLVSLLPPVSYVAITRLARDVAGDALTETFSRLNAEMAEPVVLRTMDEVAALFADLESVEPGVVQLPQWHPSPDAPAPGPLPMWCGVARKAAGRF